MSVQTEDTDQLTSDDLVWFKYPRPEQALGTPTAYYAACGVVRQVNGDTVTVDGPYGAPGDGLIFRPTELHKTMDACRAAMSQEAELPVAAE